jgi:hypothetical protein
MSISKSKSNATKTLRLKGNNKQTDFVVFQLKQTTITKLCVFAAKKQTKIFVALWLCGKIDIFTKWY